MKTKKLKTVILVCFGAVVLASCTGKKPDTPDAKQRSSSYAPPKEEIKQTPAAIKRMYNFIINNKKFEGVRSTEQEYLSLIKIYQTLAFSPTTEEDGTVFVETRREINSVTHGNVVTGKRKDSFPYYITEEGKIIIGGLVLEKNGISSLKSNETDDKGWTIYYHPVEYARQQVQQVQTDNWQNRESVVEEAPIAAKEFNNNDWLIGSWGPATEFGNDGNIEYTTSTIDILDDHTLVHHTTIKWTKEFVAFAKQYNKNYNQTNPVYSKTKCTYTVDNNSNTINTNDGTGGTLSYTSIHFDKAKQTLNIGSEEKPLYLRKKTSNANSAPPQNEVGDTDTYAANDDDERAQSYVAKNKAFFYKQPSENTIREKVYLAEGDVVTIDEIRDGFGYTVFTNTRGQETRGWIKMEDLIIDNNN